MIKIPLVVVSNAEIGISEAVVFFPKKNEANPLSSSTAEGIVNS